MTMTGCSLPTRKLVASWFSMPLINSKARSREGMSNPVGLALDTENRFLYVADVNLDQVLVYDADSFQLLRKMGTTGKDHTLTTPGNFAKPSGVAVDKDGNVYVADMLNARIEVFDPDGNFIRTFGKRGDGPGYFAMPKGVAIDADDHIWVTDPMQNRMQVYSQEGRLLIYVGGGQGLLPGMFSGVQYVTIDKQNRVFTSEVFPGRVQEFRYVTQDEATGGIEKRREAAKKAKSAASADSGCGGVQTRPASLKFLRAIVREGFRPLRCKVQIEKASRGERLPFRYIPDGSVSELACTPSGRAPWLNQASFARLRRGHTASRIYSSHQPSVVRIGGLRHPALTMAARWSGYVIR